MQTDEDSLPTQIRIITTERENLGKSECGAWTPGTVKLKRKIIVSLIIAIATASSIYTNISTFLPLFTMVKYQSITTTQIGLILCMYQVAALLLSSVIGAYLKKIGRKNAIIIGYIIMIIATFSFGLLTMIKNDRLFFVLSMVIRFFQGAADTFILIASLSIVTIEYPSRRTLYIGYCQSSIGLGYLLGPVIGSIIYSYLEYAKTFYCFAGFLIAMLIIVIFTIPQRVNFSIEPRYTFEMTTLQETEIPYKVFFTNKRVWVALITTCIAMIQQMFFDGTLTLKIQSLGIPDDKIGYIIAIACFFYAVFSIVVGTLSKKVKWRFITQVSLILVSCSAFFLGPSQVLQFPNQLWMLIIGEALNGLSIAFIYVPMMAEIIEAVKEKEKLKDSSQLNDKAAALFSVATALGWIAGPILGGAMNEIFGFRYMCDIIGFCSLLFAIIYFFISTIPKLCHKPQRRVQPTIQIEKEVQVEIEDEEEYVNSECTKREGPQSHCMDDKDTLCIENKEFSTMFRLTTEDNMLP